MIAGRTTFATVATVALGLASSAALPPRASAVLVYEHPTSHTMVAARDDGSRPKTIGNGQRPAVAPDGRHVAFLTNVHSLRGDLRIASIGGSHSALLAHDISTLSRVVWSPDSRYLMARTDRNDGAVLIDVKRRRKRAIADAAPYGGASFAPDSSRVACASIEHTGGALSVVNVRSGPGQLVADGSSPAWGQPGIAFADDTGHVFLKRSIHAQAKLLLDDHGGDPLPLAWATRAHRLLIADLLNEGSFKALVIDTDTGALSRNPTTFSSVDGIASHGHTFLAETRGNVVVVSENGSIRTLGAHARAGSWTK